MAGLKFLGRILRSIKNRRRFQRKQRETRKLIEKARGERKEFLEIEIIEGLKNRPNLLLALPPELHVRIIQYLDPLSQVSLQRTCSHFYRIINVDVDDMRYSVCARFAFLAMLEQDGQLRNIPKLFGGSKLDWAPRFACALCRKFHKRADFKGAEVMGVDCDMLDRKPRERFCGKRYRLARRFERACVNEWVFQKQRLCMHCGEIKSKLVPADQVSPVPHCLCSCEYCLVAEHDSFTRFYNFMWNKHGLRYVFMRNKVGELLVRESYWDDVKKEVGAATRANWVCEEMKHPGLLKEPCYTMRVYPAR
ncbi:MAG: hypothetical protein M1825_004586 [Sarcosagium campestre]|nr:MAG: hypothetical protein M1825_004586 [Sarcosagium campestre]